jgi:murein DD-endopeptidase MepM/ murein hydrolase activator NlpD
MERAISEMEKIRRAEEIYAKRRNMSDETSREKKPKSMYKYLFQGLLLINLAIIIVAFQNKSYIFTEDFINQISGYNVNIKEKIEELLKSESITKNEGIIDENNTQMVEQTVENESESQENNTQNVATLVENESLSQNEENELSQMELDAQIIKEKYSIILPISGIKTSGFGSRSSSSSIVTSYHTGVDIAASSGTVINSATSGKVTLVSSKGDYGKHLKVESDNLTILYAHCLKIYVSEGDEIVQGNPIAEVGSTGNSTGPHLHFEIRYEDRYVNPELILEI